MMERGRGEEEWTRSRNAVKMDERRHEERHRTRTGSNCKCPKNSSKAHTTTPSLITDPNN